jgi:hypothetical protein
MESLLIPLIYGMTDAHRSILGIEVNFLLARTYFVGQQGFSRDNLSIQSRHGLGQAFNFPLMGNSEDPWSKG